MDAREVKVYGVIKNLLVHLMVDLDIRHLMDIVIIDVPDSWGMLLSRKFTHDLGGTLQMDLSYTTIPSIWSLDLIEGCVPGSQKKEK
jgi:hypothetical protein